VTTKLSQNKNMKLYNSLSRKIEDFIPVNPELVRLYSCGPTVYDYLHIGNLRTATLTDTLKRSLRYLDFNVLAVMNITDVEDKIEKKARDTNSTVAEITKKYEEIYFRHISALNITADEFPHATENIDEMIQLIKILIEKDYAYQNKFGIYFDITKDKDYGKLGNTFHSDHERNRVEFTEGKRNQEDFALWKFPIENEQRQMLWKSLWGDGFPGWHIECSAMSMKYLSHAFDQNKLSAKDFQTIDIHTGGDDLKEVHHENEIAQTESAVDKEFVKYWVHGAMLNVNEDKMSKSLNNFITLETIIERGIEPLALRYFYYSTHYRKIQNFTWESLEGAAQGLKNLRAKYAEIKNILNSEIENKFSPNSDDLDQVRKKFKDHISDDLNMPAAMATIWDLIKSKDVNPADKTELLDEFDMVLGLEIAKTEENIEPDLSSENVMKAYTLIIERNLARENKDFALADEIRGEIEELGFDVIDSTEGTEIKLK